MTRPSGLMAPSPFPSTVAKGRSVSYPLLLDPTKSVSRLYQVDNLPMTVLIDRGGIVRHVHRDYSAKDEALYLNELRALLNE